jgi:hypothetical protein
MASNKPARPKRQTHITDARGRKVTQLDPVELRLLRRHDVIEPEALKVMASEIGSGLDDKQRRLLWVFGISIALIAVVFIIHTIDMCLQGRWIEILDFGNVAMLNLWFWPLVMWVRARQVRFKKIRRVMLRHRHCPHCGYDLRGLPPDDQDDATVCPECGCAWKLDSGG